jgi:hypothetical protein
MMKKKKTIILWDPQLRRIRNNLREILIQAAINKDEKFRGTIAHCAVCNRSNQNMTFNPGLKEWYCTECYKLIQDDYKQRKVLRAKGEDYGDFREEFYKTFI